jgi:4-amino-4-deoxy-L-arabinose transferase-like glycosyltransferase
MTMLILGNNMKQREEEVRPITLSSHVFSKYLYLAVIAIFLASLLSRLHFTGITFEHPDEPIAFGVVSGMLQQHTLDTNWLHFDVSKKFHYAQFNFSSFHIFLTSLCWLIGTHTISSMRVICAVLGALCIPVSFALGRRLHSNGAGLFAAFMTAISPQLFFDSLFARPDSFFTLLYLIALLVSIKNPRSLTRVFVCSMLFGVLTACKLSALLVAPIPLALFLINKDSYDRTKIVVALFVAGLLSGFLIGAPFALLDLKGYASGISYLLMVYSKGGGPTGLRNASVFERLWYLLSYLAFSVGPVIVVACAFIGRHASKNMIVTGAISVLSILYLGSSAFFYERNFDHCMPVVFILGWAGLCKISAMVQPVRRQPALAVLAVIALLPSIYYSYQLQYEVLSGRYQKRVDAYLNKQTTRSAPAIVWPSIVYYEPLAAIRGYMKDKPTPMVISFAWSDDQYAQANISAFLDSYQAVKVDEMRDPFWRMPTCSIQAYVSQSYVTYQLLARK